MLRFLFYVLRWQLSTPILWLVVSRLGTGIEATIVANLIGASIFFWVDRLIFRPHAAAVWELLTAGICADCGEAGRVRRLVLAPAGRKGSTQAYDRRDDQAPQYRCPRCSARKLGLLSSQGKIGRIEPLQA